MRKLVVEKTEGTYTICVDKEKKYFAIETSEIPEAVKAGDKLTISDDGIITVEKKANK